MLKTWNFKVLVIKEPVVCVIVTPYKISSIVKTQVKIVIICKDSWTVGILINLRTVVP